jgi:urease accessory protein
MPDSTIISTGARNWQAQLHLGFADDGGTTRLIERRHSGPLRVQKALYPEGGKICHAIVLHPPGGVVGGDQLAITARIGSNSHALLTTPGAGKWYKANGHVSAQQIQFTVAAAAKLEWLPQESIFFDAAVVDLQQTIHLAQDACYIGWEILCFGRRASNERFNSGQIRQKLRIERDGKLIWWEQGGVVAQSEAMHSPLGLGGKTVCATLVAVGQSLPAASLAALREQVNALIGAGEFGISQTKAVLVARYLGDSSELARQIMVAVWQHVRPHVMGCAAQVPRIWNT